MMCKRGTYSSHLKLLCTQPNTLRILKSLPVRLKKLAWPRSQWCADTSCLLANLKDCRSILALDYHFTAQCRSLTLSISSSLTSASCMRADTSAGLLLKLSILNA